MKICQKNLRKYLFIFLLIVLLLITVSSIYKLFIYIPPERTASFPASAQSEESFESEIPNCRVCYLLNLDGMKGLGHLCDSSAQKAMDAFLSREDLPKYQIYTHNCDTAARELIALIDPEASAFNETEAGLFPKSNYKNMCRSLGESWGFGPLGKDSWQEIGDFVTEKRSFLL